MINNNNTKPLLRYHGHIADDDDADGDDATLAIYTDLSTLHCTYNNKTISNHPKKKKITGPALAKVREELSNAIILGHQGGTNLSTAFASADIFFFPSTTETWGNVAMEAMASGTTVVCAKGPGGSELVVYVMLSIENCCYDYADINADMCAFYILI